MNPPPISAFEIDHKSSFPDHLTWTSDLGMSSASVIRPQTRDPTCRSSERLSVPSKDLSLLHQLSKAPSRNSLVQTPSPMLYEDQLNGLQVRFGFPKGLATELGETRSLFPARFWILDNSGSMLSNDGAIITPRNERVACTRWKELQATVEYHAELASLLQATTHFRLLNDPGVRVGPQEFSIAAEGQSTNAEVEDVQDILYKTKPFGSTPLTGHLVEITGQIAQMAETMWQKGLRAVVIIATDGLPTSVEGETSEEITNEFISAIQHLQSLPVWVVVRLCTDERAVVDFYNQLDNVLALPLEVVDDHTREAKEIQRFNSWLNYALPLHRCREIGYPHRIFDLLDERPLDKDEIREFCELMFGNEHFINAPDVKVDWNGFCNALSTVVGRESLHWNPLKKKLMPWIDVAQLKRFFGGGLRGMLQKNTPVTLNKVSRARRRRKGSF